MFDGAAASLPFSGFRLWHYRQEPHSGHWGGLRKVREGSKVGHLEN